MKKNKGKTAKAAATKGEHAPKIGGVRKPVKGEKEALTNEYA